MRHFELLKSAEPQHEGDLAGSLQINMCGTHMNSDCGYTHSIAVSVFAFGLRGLMAMQAEFDHSHARGD
jgi:hypothetical protein